MLYYGSEMPNCLLKENPSPPLSFLIQYDLTHSLSHRSYINSILANKRRKKRILWSVVNERISDQQSCRMFRMTRPCFNLLCQNIIRYTGEKAFKSEAYIDAFFEKQVSNVRSYQQDKWWVRLW